MALAQFGTVNLIPGSVPQFAQAGVGDRLVITSILRNNGTGSGRISFSSLEYRLPNGTVLLASNKTENLKMPSRGTASSSHEVVLTEAFASAAHGAGFDRIEVWRTFFGHDTQNNPFQCTTRTPIRITSALTGHAQARDVRITVPTDEQAIGKGEELFPIAQILCTGSGTIRGTWLLDGRPFEGFTVHASAGSPVQVRSRRPIPALEFGNHSLSLEVAFPNRIRSRSVGFTVSTVVRSTRIRLLSQSITGGRATFLWQPIPGASGYEFAVAENAEAVGFEAGGTPQRGAAASKAFSPASQIVFRRVGNGATTRIVLSETEQEHLRSFASRGLVWSVRPLFPPLSSASQDRAAIPQAIATMNVEASLRNLTRAAANAAGSLDPVRRSSHAATSPLPWDLSAPLMAVFQDGSDSEPPGLRLRFSGESKTQAPPEETSSAHMLAVLDGKLPFSPFLGAINLSAAKPLAGGPMEVRSFIGNLADPDSGLELGIGDTGFQISEFTAEGGQMRTGQLAGSLMGFKLRYGKSLDSLIGRTALGTSTTVEFGSIETEAYESGSGFRLTRMEGREESSAYGTFVDASTSGLRSNIWSLTAQHPITPELTGKAEIATSKSRFLTSPGVYLTSNGDAKKAELEYTGFKDWTTNLKVFNLSSDFKSPAAANLRSNVKGWEGKANTKLTPNAGFEAGYSNIASSQIGEVPGARSRSLFATVKFEDCSFAPLELTYREARSVAKAFGPGLHPSSTLTTELSAQTSRKICGFEVELGYTFERFTDKFAVAVPTDTPADQQAGYITLGASGTIGNLSIRADYSDNRIQKFGRHPATSLLMQGLDRTDNLRVQGDLPLGRGYSCTAILARSRQSDLIGMSPGSVEDLSLRLNWQPESFLGGGYVFTVEYRTIRSLNFGNRDSMGVWSFLLNGGSIRRWE